MAIDALPAGGRRYIEPVDADEPADESFEGFADAGEEVETAMADEAADETTSERPNDAEPADDAPTVDAPSDVASPLADLPPQSEPSMK